MYAGVPSVFIRTSGCNLRCLWCDTKHTSWTPEGTATSVEDIIDATDSMVPHVVITGGEPLIQRTELKKLVNALRDRGQVVTIETTGTIYDNEVTPDLWSVSPKLGNSLPVGHEPQLRIHEKNNTYGLLPKFASSGVKIQYKFVMEANDDINDIMQLIAKYDIPSDAVFLMPQAVDVTALAVASKWIGELCMKYRFNFSPRLQVLGSWE
jgi:7-carboxy-7-deazaguanine synthase